MTLTWPPGNYTEFELPVEFAIGAVFFFAITGALAAIRRHYDIIGVFTMAFVTGLGGALIRDGVFIQHGPPALMRDWRYLGAVPWWLRGRMAGGTSHRTFPTFDRRRGRGRARRFQRRRMQISKAAGLGVVASVLVGVINACGGGLLRDVIVRDEPLMLKPGQFYVLASVVGCGLFAYLTTEGILELFPGRHDRDWSHLFVPAALHPFQLAHDPVKSWRRPPGVRRRRSTSLRFEFISVLIGLTFRW
jgi:hypothetical protein